MNEERLTDLELRVAALEQQKPGKKKLSTSDQLILVAKRTLKDLQEFHDDHNIGKMNERDREDCSDYIKVVATLPALRKALKPFAL